jgi:hypothetical protein
MKSERKARYFSSDLCKSRGTSTLTIRLSSELLGSCNYWNLGLGRCGQLLAVYCLASTQIGSCSFCSFDQKNSTLIMAPRSVLMERRERFQQKFPMEYYWTATLTFTVVLLMLCGAAAGSTPASS